MPHRIMDLVSSDSDSSPRHDTHPSPRVLLQLAALALLALSVCAMGLSAQTDPTAAVPAEDMISIRPVPERFEAAREFIERVMRERDIPSVAVAVAKDGEVLWEAAFGWADRERRVRATPHTMYSLASISKPITATALMTLVEDGRVDIGRPANDYLGSAAITGLAGPASGATVRRVLSHTSGLPLHYRFFFEDDPHPVATHDEAIARYGLLVNPPGAVYEYSNLGYGILGRIVERASGDRLDDVVRREVFAPLGMTRSAVGLPPALEPWAARRYDADVEPIPYYRFDHDGASAAWASAHDLIRFALFHLGHGPDGARPALADSTRASMQRAVPPADYGLGWFIDSNDHGLRCVWHSGSMPGVSTMLRMYPDEDLAVVVLLNTLDRPMRLRIAQELAAAVVPAYARALRAAESARAARPDTGEGDERAGPAFDPPADIRGEWSGTLRTHQRELPMRMVVQPDGDVHVALEGQLETLLDRARWNDGRLTGLFAGRIPTEDALRHDHVVGLELTLRDGRLAGRATALTVGGERTYFALSSWVELSRAVAMR